MKRFELFQHKADMGIRGFGETPDKAFENAALALSSAITELGKIEPRTRVDIECNSDDLEILFYDWINAVIYQMAVRRMLFCKYEVNINNGRLTASAWGEEIVPDRHEPAVEAKGATMSALKVGRTKSGRYSAQLIVDV